MITCNIHGKTDAINFIKGEELLLCTCFRCFVDKLKELGLKEYPADIKEK